MRTKGWKEREVGEQREIERQRQRQRQRQRETETEREAEREAERDTETHRDTHRDTEREKDGGPTCCTAITAAVASITRTQRCPASSACSSAQHLLHIGNPPLMQSPRYGQMRQLHLQEETAHRSPSSGNKRQRRGRAHWCVLNVPHSSEAAATAVFQQRYEERASASKRRVQVLEARVAVHVVAVLALLRRYLQQPRHHHDVGDGRASRSARSPLHTW
jgi:hypothetical protein